MGPWYADFLYGILTGMTLVVICVVAGVAYAIQHKETVVPRIMTVVQREMLKAMKRESIKATKRADHASRS